MNRQSLLAAKLRALVRGRWGDLEAEPSSFPGGAAVRSGTTGWVLAEDDPRRSLGRALLWADSARVGDLHLLVEHEAGTLARRAPSFRLRPRVWRIRDTRLEPAEPQPLAPEPELDPRAAALADLLRAAGAEPVVEHGILFGEVRGLEVARVSVDADGVRLEIGVGKHDRHAQSLVHGDRPAPEALRRAVETVEALRRADAHPHPLNRLAAERWLRWRLLAEPQLVGLDYLLPIPSPTRRDDLRQPAPALATGVDATGDPVVVGCSTGIDLDLVPCAVDGLLADDRQARLVLVVPEGDDHPAQRTLAGALVEPAQLLTVPHDWRRP